MYQYNTSIAIRANMIAGRTLPSTIELDVDLQAEVAGDPNFRVPWRARKGDGVADIRHAGDELHNAF